MLNSKSNKNYQKKSIIEEYLECISYCDIHPKGIDYDCEITCKQNYFKSSQKNN